MSNHQSSQAIIVGEWSIFITLDAFQHLDIKAANTKLNKVVIVNLDKQGESTFSIRSHNTLPSLAEVQMSPRVDSGGYPPMRSPSPSQLRMLPRSKTLKTGKWSDTENEDSEPEPIRDRSGDDDPSENEEGIVSNPSPSVSPSERKRRERAEMEVENHDGASSTTTAPTLGTRSYEGGGMSPSSSSRTHSSHNSPLWNMQPQWQSDYLQRQRAGAFLFDENRNSRPPFPTFASSQPQSQSHQQSTNSAFSPPQQHHHQQPQSPQNPMSSRFHADAIFPSSSFLLPMPNVSPSPQFPPAPTTTLSPPTASQRSRSHSTTGSHENPKVTMRFMLQSFVMRWHHNAPVYSAYWDQEAGEIAIEIEGQMLLDCSPSNVWDEVLLVMVKRKEGASGWKVVEQTRHCFATPYQIKISRKEKGSKNSLWYQYQVCKIDTGAPLAVSPPIRPKTSRTINDKYVKNLRPPVKDFMLNCFELSFSGVTSPPSSRSEAADDDKEVNRRPSERVNNERRDREKPNDLKRSLSNPNLPPGFLGQFDRRSLTYPLPEVALHTSGTHVDMDSSQQEQQQQHQQQLPSINSPPSVPMSAISLSHQQQPQQPRPGEDGPVAPSVQQQQQPAAISATNNNNTIASANNANSSTAAAGMSQRQGHLTMYNSPGPSRNNF